MRHKPISRKHDMELRPGLKPPTGRLLLGMATLVAGLAVMLAGVVSVLVA